MTPQQIAPGRKKNRDYRSREHLTPQEVQRLIAAAGERGRHRLRDHTLLLQMFRHGLRAGEACLLKWDAVMFDERSISITRLKDSESGIHRLQSDEIAALGKLKEQYPDSYHLFVGERGEKLTTGAIAKIIQRAGELADLPLPVHPHMLRHSCGYYLAEQGLPTRDIQEYLGHKNIQHTVRYIAANPARFDRIQWQLIGRMDGLATP
jgi:type 1 fimbriae regulatory protein FimB/type 1 fimbriae regulatory protein FimE